MSKLFTSLAANVGTLGAFALMLLMPLGWAYWLWIAVHIGSFLMFFLGIAGPFAIVIAPLGLWSFLFGTPAWLLSMFG